MFKMDFTIDDEVIKSYEYETEEQALEIISNANKFVDIQSFLDEHGESVSNKWTWRNMIIEIIEV